MFSNVSNDASMIWEYATTAEHLLCKLEQEYESNNKLYIPNSKLYTSVINAYSRTGKSGCGDRTAKEE